MREPYLLVPPPRPAPQLHVGGRGPYKRPRGQTDHVLIYLQELIGTMQRGLLMDEMVCKIKTGFSTMQTGRGSKEMESQARRSELM